jgi:regulator of protease activity HflC (stomatin/prohibitin superfamily)
MEGLILVLVAAAIAAGIWFWRSRADTTIYSYQKGVMFRDGAVDKVLGAGRYRYFSTRTRIEAFDMRKIPLNVAGQEILTKDHVNVRVSLVGNYQIVDPVKLITGFSHFEPELYAVAQLAIRDQVGLVTLEEMLAQKPAIDAALLKQVTAKAEAIGISVTALAVRDVMLPANLKKLFGGFIEARKEAERNLEKARGEQAVLRSLANASKMFDDNPSLMQARIIQALGTGNNSIVFGADEKLAAKPRGGK